MGKIKTILVPTDGSDDARLALAHACNIAKQYDATLVLAHIMHLEYYGGKFAGERFDVLMQAKIEEMPADPVEDAPAEGMNVGMIEEAKLLLRNEQELVPEGVTTRLFWALGDPRADVLTVAKEVDANVIVMGSRGLGALRGALVGSVSRYVMNNSEIPVLIVK